MKVSSIVNPRSLSEIMTEIKNNGPVQAAFTV